jgi:N-acetylglucosamine kinase-like BadF-type ATPase
VHVLAVDGGASSTRALVARTDGTILAIGYGGPSNHVSGEAAKARLREALGKSIGEALERSGLGSTRFACAWLGMTGHMKHTTAPALIERAVRELVDVDAVRISGDMQTAHAGATALSPGILVYAGTGSNAYGRSSSGATAQCGGWGHVIDDEGGGYQIGRAALKAVYRASDGRGPRTKMTPLVLEHFEVRTLDELLATVYEGGGLSRSAVAALARLVIRAAAEGDPAAREILEHAGKELASLAVALADRLEDEREETQVYATGGVFLASPSLRSAFHAAVREPIPDVAFRPPRYPPVVGAVLLALQSVGAPPSARVYERIDASLAGCLGQWE